MGTGKMLLDLHCPPNKDSKAYLIFDALGECYETRRKKTRIIDKDAVQVFWGLANGNSQAIYHCRMQRIPFLFVDMPYTHRWTRHDLDWSKENALWRLIPNDIHVTQTADFDNTRYQQLNIHLQQWKKSGDKILICPSSYALTQHLAGMSDSQWADNVAVKCRELYPDFLTIVRYKPRANGTSGPDVEPISFDNVYATVTLASLVSVEASINGIPAIVTTAGVSPADSISTMLGDTLQYPDRQKWINTLANHQFSLKEIAENKIGHILEHAVRIHHR
jgi:hypothetical protein